MKYQILKCKGGYYWRIIAKNHKILAHSEVYKRHRDAAKTLEAVKRRSMYAEIEWLA